MLIKTPPLSPRSVKVFPALFKAQLPDTLNVIRHAIPEWTAVHVVVEGAGPARNAPTKEQIRDELLAQLKPMAALLSPIHTLTTPEIPPNTVCTLVPDRVRPTFAPEYQGWKFIYQADARARLKDIFDRALGGIPEGTMGVADALVKGQIRGQAVLEGWNGSLVIPAFKRTIEALIDPAGKVLFWDTAFGFETTGEAFFAMSDLILQMPGAQTDRLYFDATNFSWFLAFYPGGEMRVGMLG